MPDRETIAVYILLAGTFVKGDPYDARGAFSLLHSLEMTFDPVPGALTTALHFNAIAGLEKNNAAQKDARWSLTRVVVHLERMLVRPEPAL
jgi:hypothetical protein